MSNIETITAMFEETKKMIENLEYADMQQGVALIEINDIQQKQGVLLTELSKLVTQQAKVVDSTLAEQRGLRAFLNRELPLCKKPKHQTEVYVMYVLLAMLLIMNLCIYVQLL